MNRRKLVCSLVLTLGTALLSGCFFVDAPPTGEVVGYVVDHLSGEPVVGATVVAYPEGGKPKYVVDSNYFGPLAVTDSQGFYRLVLPKSTTPYTIDITKSGHAWSRIEGVVVTSTVRHDVVLKPVANPNWSLVPPTITVTGIAEGGTYAATTPISIKIDATGPNDIQHIYAAFGKMPGAALLTAPRAIYSNTYTTGTFTITPSDYGVSGWTTFEVVVYDWNDNRTHRIYRVYVTPAADPLPPIAAPLPPTANILVDPVRGVLIPPLTALAVTLNKKVEFFGVDPQAAPVGGNLYVELRWQRSPDDPAKVTGYRIYRRLATEADFRLLYTVQATGAATYLYRDATPDLLIGLTATYRIVAYQGNVESLPLEASTTPLPTWDVKLLTPVDEASGVGLFPTFTWAPTAVVGTTQFYRVRLWDTPHGGYTITITAPLNTTSVTYGGIPGTGFERLQPHRMYQWEMQAAFAMDVTTANAVSIAANYGYTGAFPTQRAWEIFTFTTGDW